MTASAIVTASSLGLITLLSTGLPIAFSILAICLGYMLITGMQPDIAGATMFWFLNKSSLVAIPFFILSAEILSRSGATDALVKASNVLCGRLPNGLALVTVVAIMVFSAISGSSVATAVAIGRVMIPQLIQNGYKARFAVGLVAASGGLGILIPPSIPLIVYAAVVEISVGDLFISAMLPGLMLGSMLFAFVLLIGDWARTKKIATEEKLFNPGDRRKALLMGLPMFCFPLIILGGIYGGVFTPTEAAAMSVLLATLLSFTIYRSGSLAEFSKILTQSGTMAATILIIMAATSVLSYILSYEQIPKAITELIAHSDISPIVFILAINLLLLALGCFLEIISVILIVVPILLPTLNDLGIDPIYFGIILIVNMELAVITPPIGMNLFVVSAISRQSIGKVFQGALPFVGVITLGLIILILFPPISTIFVR